MVNVSSWRAVAVFSFSCLVLASCADRQDAPGSPAGNPTAPGPTQSALTVSARCFGPFQVASYAPLACVVSVEDGTNPSSTDLQAFADLRAFGSLAEFALVRCPACGAPRVFDLDLHVPADMTPGTKTFTVWATDAQGRRGQATATLEIVPR